MPGSPLFNVFGGGGNGPSLIPPGIRNLITSFQQFKQTFQGDPRQQVQDLLNSGRISQDQYNQAVQMANELQKYLH